MATPDERSKSVPRLAAGCDITRLPIGAIEGFILSRVDGGSSVSQIGSMTGLGVEQVAEVVEKLADLGALEIPGYAPKKPVSVVPPPTAAQTAAAVAAAGMAAVVNRPLGVLSVHYDPKELEQVDALPLELKKRVLDLFYNLEDLDHYQMLGLTRQAERKAIKSAYYAFAATFHTDRYFGKELGPYKQKMEAVFGRATVAHDTLTNKTKRAEYDEYVVERDRTRAFEQLLAAVDSDPDAGAADVLQTMTSAQPTPAPAPSEPDFSTSSAPPIAVSSSPSSPPGSPSVSSTTMRAATPVAPLSPQEERIRRETLARRLAGTRASSSRHPAVNASRPPPPMQGSPSPRPPASDSKLAAESLKRRYDQRVDGARKAQAKKFIERAESDLQKSDVVSAANNYRLALQWTDDPAVAAVYDETNRKARDVMADAYLKQAKYEEGAGKWREAALSYAKAHDGRPDDPEIAQRAAEALRREGRDLHRAARFAELSVQKNPNNALFRVTLGHVYLDAGLVLRARSELEQATRLAPADAKAKELLAQARKMAS